MSSCSSDRLLGAKRTERAGPSLSFFEAGDNDGRSSSAGGKFSFITEGVGKVTRGTWTTSSDPSTSESQLDGFLRFAGGLAGETCSETERGFVNGGSWRLLEEAPLESACRVR